MSKNDTIEEGAKAGHFEPLHIKHGKTLMESCVYCGQSHVEEYLCLKAKAAGVTKADLPQAYRETGEVAAPTK